jgi:hypothetical protein
LVSLFGGSSIPTSRLFMNKQTNTVLRHDDHLGGGDNFAREHLRLMQKNIVLIFRHPSAFLYFHFTPQPCLQPSTSALN